MLHQQEKRSVGMIVFSTALCAFASLIAPPVRAQQPTPATAAERARQQRQARRDDQMETEMRINSLERESRQPSAEKSANPANAQLKDDFEQLQSVNNQMMETVFANNVLDYKRLFE